MEIAPPADPLAAVTHPDPYPYYAQLALLESPVWNDRLKLWIVANPEQVAELLDHPAAHVLPPFGAPAGYGEFARFTNGQRHAQLRAEVIERIAGLQIDDPQIEITDLDAFVELFALYALVRDVRSHVKGDLLFQSFDATRGLIGNALAALAADPSLRPDEAVDWAVRCDPPVHNTRRTMAADVEFYGARFRAGETALVVLVNATFGLGVHACPGDSVAREIAKRAVRRVVASGIARRAPVGYLARPNVRIPLFNRALGYSGAS